MVKEEEKDLDKEEGLKRKDHPLSPADWIMFLSGEIYDEKNTTDSDNTTPIIALFVVVAFSIMTLMFAAISSDLTDEAEKDILIKLEFGFYILAIFMLCFVGYTVYRFLWVRPKARERVDALENIRDKILRGDLEEYDEIYKPYKSAKEFK